MKELLLTILLWFCALGCGLLGGLYFAFSAIIMRSLQLAGPASGIAAMNAINKHILRSAFMPFFFGTTIAAAVLALAGLLALDQPRAPYLIAGGAIYVLGMFVVTMLFNVPLNNALAEVGEPTRTGTAIWADYLVRWTRWNHVRTVACMIAAALFIAALTLGSFLRRSG